MAAYPPLFRNRLPSNRSYRKRAELFLMSISNRAGHPVRNRKRNRLIYNEDEETSFGPQNRFTLYTSPIVASKQSKSSLSVSNRQDEFCSSYKSKFNKNIGTSLANSLKTLLKLNKANNWVNHEWFYGNIDQVLFLDENEFNICLRDSFPQLKTRFLTRLEWSQIRRLMGKPRRCSSSFFEEERATLNSKRNKIRYLQQNKVTDLRPYKDLPDNIPQPLIVGNQVSALARLHDGLHFGVIEGIDPVNGTYRVGFNRPEIGSLSIPDYEVSSAEMPIIVPLSSFQIKTRKIWHLSNRFVECNTSDASAHSKQADNKITFKQSTERNRENNIGGFPIKFLCFLVKASRILTLKKKKINELKKMNSEIERRSTFSEKITYSFKKQYALSIVELDKVNQELNFYLKKIQNYSLQVASEGKIQSLKPDVVGQKYLVESRLLVEKLLPNFKVNEKTCELIIYLMSLMFHLRGFRDSEVSSYEFQSITNTISRIQGMIGRNNLENFQNNVEIHVRHIMSSVSHLGNVGAFSDPAGYDGKLEN